MGKIQSKLHLSMLVLYTAVLGTHILSPSKTTPTQAMVSGKECDFNEIKGSSCQAQVEKNTLSCCHYRQRQKYIKVA